jgi:hypothetical protein
MLWFPQEKVSVSTWLTSLHSRWIPTMLNGYISCSSELWCVMSPTFNDISIISSVSFIGGGNCLFLFQFESWRNDLAQNMLLWTAHNISTGFWPFTHLPMGRGFINQFDIRLSDPALTPIKSPTFNDISIISSVSFIGGGNCLFLFQFESWRNDLAQNMLLWTAHNISTGFWPAVQHNFKHCRL